MEQSQVLLAILFFVQLFVYALIFNKISDVFFKYIHAKYGLRIMMLCYNHKQNVQKIFQEQERIMQEVKAKKLEEK